MERKATAAHLTDDSEQADDNVCQFHPTPTGTETAGTSLRGELIAPERWRARELGHDAAADFQMSRSGAVFGWPLLIVLVALAGGIALTFLGH